MPVPRKRSRKETCVVSPPKMSVSTVALVFMTLSGRTVPMALVTMPPIVTEKHRSMKTRPVAAGLTRFLPVPPNSILTMMMEKAEPSITS